MNNQTGVTTKWYLKWKFRRGWTCNCSAFYFFLILFCSVPFWEEVFAIVLAFHLYFYLCFAQIVVQFQNGEEQWELIGSRTYKWHGPEALRCKHWDKVAVRWLSTSSYSSISDTWPGQIILYAFFSGLYSLFRSCCRGIFHSADFLPSQRATVPDGISRRVAGTTADVRATAARTPIWLKIRRRTWSCRGGGTRSPTRSCQAQTMYAPTTRLLFLLYEEQLN